MKSTYISPLTKQIEIQVTHMISESTTNQKIYTDDSQTTGGALVREDASFDNWDNDSYDE